MSVSLYMDVHVPRAVTAGLRLRGVDVLTAQQDAASRFADDELLLRASSLGRILVTQDVDLLREGTRFLREGLEFSGVVFGHQLLISIGGLIDDLTLIAQASEPGEWVGRICHLPL